MNVQRAAFTWIVVALVSAVAVGGCTSGLRPAGAALAVPPGVQAAGQQGDEAQLGGSQGGEAQAGEIQSAVGPRFCPPEPAPRVVEIRTADPAVDKQHHDAMRRLLIDSLPVPNTTVVLGPHVVLDFSDVSDDDVPLGFGPCVTLTSAAWFWPDLFLLQPQAGAQPAGENGIAGASLRPGAVVRRPDLRDMLFQPGPARTPHSLGPLLRFGRHRSDAEKVFLVVACPAGFPPNDHVRISGLRIYGPSFGQQSHDDIGIHVVRCLDVEISNMEIAGWGGQAIQVLDDPQQGPGQEPPNNLPGDRIGRPEQVRIFGNYIHHNQHPREGVFNSHAAGYGVDVHHGAWAQVYQNVFDSNRHAIAAAGDTGGYEALWNLVLKGGGYHYAGFHTHQFDIHGSGRNGFGGQAGIQFWFRQNSFQYLSGPAIEIRGRPHIRIYIRDNIFAHDGLEDDWGADAIHLDDRDDLDVIEIGPGNATGFDSYGHYGVCDFDGDAIDDLFLATGRTWWFSSFGEFQWTYLTERIERLAQVRLGYFDGDGLCDVLTESGEEWVISSGGTGPWVSIGAFGTPLRDVVFGRFDPNVRDHRPGVTRRTTHAFRRLANGQWEVTPLTAAAWQPVQSSSVPLSRLRFGDFTGDGVTDVLSVQGGRWAISQSATGSWRRLNAFLGDDVRTLYMADLNNNNIDDLIKLERTSSRGQFFLSETYTWWVSDDGQSRWRKVKTYKLTFPISAIVPAYGYAGRFGAAPGGGMLLIGRERIGRFFSEAEIEAGASPEWTSLFAY